MDVPSITRDHMDVHHGNMDANPLSSLPLHLVALILSHLDAVDQLPNAILSHRIFHAALHDLPTLTSDMLRTQIDDDETFILALVTQASSPVQRASRRISAYDLLVTWREDPARLVAPYRCVKVSEGRQIGELHGVIAGLRESFVQHVARALYGVADGQELSVEGAKLSPAEMRRINRAIYRFQVYVNLFGQDFREGEDGAELQRMFFDRHSPGVNEQLACFCDFLEAKLNEVLDYVVAQFPVRAGWLNDANKQARRQAYLSLGLPWLYQLFTTSNAEARYTLLQTSQSNLYFRRTTSLEVPATNFRQRQRSIYPESDSDWNLDIPQLVREFDVDDGPQQMWTSTRRGGGNDLFTVVDHDRALRRLGYVLWDSSRVYGEELCRQSIEKAQGDTTPTFAAPGRFIDVARSRARPLPQVQQTGLSARDRRAARKRNIVNV